ncbi:MAG: response regulator [Microgenomates group bacterium]
MIDQKMPRILIAEDEKALARVLELKLTKAGFAVMIAEDGEEASKLLANEHFDLLLLDLVMPKKDGFAVLSELAGKKATLPVVVLSNLGQTEDERKAKVLGAVDYWVKADISLVDVVNRIKKLLDISA